MKFINTLSLILIGIALSCCSTGKSASDKPTNATNMESNTILEVTTFNIKSDVDPQDFTARDRTIESDFTSKQAGFIKRQSGVNEKGEYVVKAHQMQMHP